MEELNILLDVGQSPIYVPMNLLPPYRKLRGPRSLSGKKFLFCWDRNLRLSIFGNSWMLLYFPVNVNVEFLWLMEQPCVRCNIINKIVFYFFISYLMTVSSCINCLYIASTVMITK